MKRRKANQIQRLYVCGDKNCHKQYGSYPALYTHIKLKHKGIEPEGTIKSIAQVKEQLRNQELQKMSNQNEETLESQLLKTVTHYASHENIPKHQSCRKSSKDYFQLNSSSLEKKSSFFSFTTKRLLSFLDKVASNMKQNLFKEICGIADLVNHCIEQRKRIKSFLEAKEDYEEIVQYVQDYIEYGKGGQFKLVVEKRFVQSIVWVFINAMFLRD